MSLVFRKAYIKGFFMKILKKLFMFLTVFFCLSLEGSLVPDYIISNFCKPYSSKEMFLIERDYSNIKDLCFEGCKGLEEGFVYIATAGGPGASKSTILEKFISRESNFVYLDPDQRSLKFMINTYLQDLTCLKISKLKSYSDLLFNAYNKWRSASNYISNSILNLAFEGGYNIAHGTTSTSSQVWRLYEGLKNKGYKIKLLLCGSTYENCVNATNNRSKSQGFCQNSDTDTVEKGKMFFENFPIYFKYADEIHFFWTDNFSEGSKKIGLYNWKEDLKVFDQEGMNKLIQAYEDYRKDSDLPSFNGLLYSTVRK